MAKFKGAILIGILMFSTIMLIADPLQYCSGAEAYYTDVKATNGCSIYAPAQATPSVNVLSITDNGQLDGNGKKMLQAEVKNNGGNSTIITGIEVWFNTIQGNATIIQGVSFGNNGGNNFFTGSANCGTIIIGAPAYTINSQQAVKFSMDFDQDIASSRPITVVFITKNDGQQIFVINPHSPHDPQ